MSSLVKHDWQDNNEMSHVRRKSVHAIFEQRRRKSACRLISASVVHWLDRIISLVFISEIQASG